MIAALTMELGIYEKNKDDKIYCNVVQTTAEGMFLFLHK